MTDEIKPYIPMPIGLNKRKFNYKIYLSVIIILLIGMAIGLYAERYIQNIKDIAYKSGYDSGMNDLKGEMLKSLQMSGSINIIVKDDKGHEENILLVRK